MGVGKALGVWGDPMRRKEPVQISTPSPIEAQLQAGRRKARQDSGLEIDLEVQEKVEPSARLPLTQLLEGPAGISKGTGAVRQRPWASPSQSPLEEEELVHGWVTSNQCVRTRKDQPTDAGLGESPVQRIQNREELNGITDGTQEILVYLSESKHLPFFNLVPTGYSEIGSDWIDTNSILERQNFGVHAALVGSTISDVDTGAVEGIAVTAASSTIGVWQYSTDGTTWTAFAGPDGTTARLLDSDDKIRFVPNANANGEATLTFRAWDKTSGTTGTPL